MSTSYKLPEGWAVNFSQTKELVYQLHGDILPANFQLDIEESSDFSETRDFAVDVPDPLQKNAKPGFVFTNQLTGAQLQKGMDGRWRKLKEIAQKTKQKAKQFVGKFTGKKQKPSAPFTPEEEYDPEYLPPKGEEDDEGPARPEPEKLQKDMKPEVTEEDIKELEGDKELQDAISQVGENIKKAYSGELTDEEKKEILTQTKKMALVAGKKMALKTGETPEVIAKTIMKEGQREFLPEIADGLKEKAIQAYQQMLHKKKEAEDSGVHHMKAYAQWEPYSKKFTQITDQIKNIQGKIGGEESFDDLMKTLKEEGLKAYQADNLQAAKKAAPKEEEKDISTDSFQKLGTMNSILEKGIPELLKGTPIFDNVKDDLSSINQSVINVLKSDGGTIKENLDYLNGLSSKFKSSISESFSSLQDKLNNPELDKDPMLKKTIQAQYDFLIKNLKNIGLDESYLPKEGEEVGIDKKEVLDQIGMKSEDILTALGKESNSIKGPLNSYLGDIKSGLFNLIDPNDIEGSIEKLNNKGSGYKDSIAASLEACYGYLSNAKNLGDPNADIAIESYKNIFDLLKKVGLEDYLPSKTPWGEEGETQGEQEEKLNPEELLTKVYEIKDGFLDLLGPQSLSIKNGVKKDLEYLQQMFFEFLDEDSLSTDIEDLKDSEPFQKAEVKNKFVQLGKKIKNMEGLGDPNAEEAIDKYKEMIKSLQGMGLEEFLPKTRQKKEDQVKPDINVPEEEQNYGKMLEPDFRYEPTVKFEDLSEKWRDGFNAYVESSQRLIDGGKLPDIYNGVTADSMAAMRKYTGSSYTWMNNLARGKADITQDPSLKKYDYMLGLVDQGLQAMKLQPPETLKRGVGSAKLRKAFSARKPGEMIYDHGYFSASSSKSTAQSFEGYGESSVMFTIKNAQGYYVDTISECKGEEERIFPRGSAFKITSIKELPNGQLSVEMEHVLSDSEKEKYQKQIEGEKQKEEEKPQAKIPKSIDESIYNSGKKLGGSTGARLIDMDGTKFVVKMGANEEQNQQEQLANSLYQTIGVKTSNSGLSEMGGKKVVVSEYIPGKDLGNQPLDTPEQIKAFGQKIIRGHAIDALVNNRDVFGLEYDNIRIGDNGEIYRIDNGGSFDTKATGGKKPYDGVPLEFFSMLERGGGKEFYRDVPIRFAYESLTSLFENISEIKEIATQQVPENLRGVFLKRLSNLREIKDCWDYARASKYGDDQECHEVIKQYITKLHKKDPNASVSYVEFKKFIK